MGKRLALKDQRGGVALILVVWIMVILVAMAGEFSYSMRTEVNIIRNFKEEEEAYQRAFAGIEQAKLEILTVKGSDYVYLNEEGILMFGENEEEKELERDVKLGSGKFQYVITDEDGKLNINTATVMQLKHVFLESGVDVSEVDTIVDSIVDWRDTNDLHMLNGAEEDYYRSLENPYSCKDAPFDSVEELLLVKGMTPEILYGTPKKNEEEKEGDDEQNYEGVIQYLTVYRSDRININTAPRIVLEAILGQGAADDIITLRETTPITGARPNGKVSSSIFTIISTGFNSDGKIKRSVKTIIQKKGNSLETVYWNDNVIG